MIEVLAPAKLNLGLEVIGRREDGYHEIRTVFCAVSLFDRVAVTAAQESDFRCGPLGDDGENLARIAVETARARYPSLLNACLAITKRIPVAGGLGGASSDAAAALIALNGISGSPLAKDQLADLALACGSDVPFFIESGLALGQGRGDKLQPLPPTPLHAVIVTPKIKIPEKTRAMYARLDPRHWSSGERVMDVADTIRRRVPLSPHRSLPNAFRQPMYDLLPEIANMGERIESVTQRALQMSGAGPSLYVLCDSVSDSIRIHRRLLEYLDPGMAALHRVRSVSTVLVREGPDV